MMCLAGCKSHAEETTTVNRPNTKTINTNYVSNRAPLVPSQFIKLPVGSIHPDGWVKKVLELQRDGLCGQLGEISAWLEKTNNAWLSKDGKGNHGWEEVPYWLKGYGDLAYILNDTEMIKETKVWIESALNSQREDGYFGPWIEKRGRPDLWGNMIMLWCLQSYYEYSGDQRVISFMTNYFKWQLQLDDSLFLKDYWENSRGGDNLYSVYWLYNITEDPFLLELGEKIHRNTANWMQADNLPNWHNVNIAQSFREPATYYQQSHDNSHLQATYNDFHLIRTLFGQVPGGMFGGDENSRKGYHDPRQGVETCGMVEQMASDEILFRISGDPFWADHCEKVAFNSYPAALMPDLRSLRYITSPNMVASDDQNHHPGIDNGGPFLIMNPFSSRCCQHNHTQGWPYYAENLWMATPDNGLVAVLYAAGTVNAKVGKGKNVVLEQKTNYPFDETIQIAVKESDNAVFPLYLRIPEWCDSAKAEVTSKGTSLGIYMSVSTSEQKNYIKIVRNWSVGDVVTLHLPMRLTMDKWEQNGNSVSINYGPLTFSLLIEENYIKKNSAETALGDSKWQKTADASKWSSYEILPASAWNYGLTFNPNRLEESFEVVKEKWAGDDFPFTTQAIPWRIKAKGAKIPDWTIDQYGLCSFVPQSPVSTTEPVEDITLIPMGAARLRISAFPVIAR
ncbi:MAG: glycoside hydrolase family 127 protein [Bacteroidales bacterium]|jgi:hypothetical protein|nr:glycoside hydrolase family 127 protein [Bacteroidales bacterium]